MYGSWLSPFPEDLLREVLTRKNIQIIPVYKKKKNYVYINPYEASSSKTFQNELKDIAHNCSNKLFIILSTPDFFFFSSFIKEQLICVAETGNQSFSVKDKKKKKKLEKTFFGSLYILNI